MNNICNLGFDKSKKEVRLSPSSIKMINDDPFTWYLQKIKKVQVFQQTLPMAVGAAFDDRIKRWLWKEFKGVELEAGKAGSGVEIQGEDRKIALDAGEEIFQFYKNSGALTWLVQEIEMRDREHKFGIIMEDWLEGTLDLGDGVMLPICGKPDLAFWLGCQKLFVMDWKVNGYCSSRTTSPKKGYTICRSATGGLTRYKEYVAGDYCGISFNKLYTIEQVDDDWAFQLLVYNWLLNGKLTGNFKIVPEEVVAGIDQILGPKCSRISSFRGTISTNFQLAKIAELKLMILNWDSMIQDLERQYQNMMMSNITGTQSKDAWFDSMVRG